MLVSYSWIYKLVDELQRDQNVLDRIYVVWNKSTYVTSSRIRNPNFVNQGVNRLNEHKNTSIRFTKLIQIIKIIL
ncbi:lantibiotic dehydratase [Peptoniphilus lacrimalis]|uniref:lantibiotic dehydratase n=1 Tax=Peptoniphilus lacrimalis TaxID=33031 RepID=UPI000E1BEF90